MRSVIHKILGLCEDAVVFVVMLPFALWRFARWLGRFTSEGTQIVKMAAKRYDFAYCERRSGFYLESFGAAYACARHLSDIVMHCHRGDDMFKAFEEHNLTINPKYIIAVAYEPSTAAHHTEQGNFVGGTVPFIRLYTTQSPPDNIIMKLYDNDECARKAFRDINDYLETLDR